MEDCKSSLFSRPLTEIKVVERHKKQTNTTDSVCFLIFIPNHLLSYNIYLDTNPDPKILINKTEETYHYLNDTLDGGTKYYWKVEVVGEGVGFHGPTIRLSADQAVILVVLPP